MPTIKEERLTFDFPAPWLAVAFDRPGGFYKEAVEKIDGLLAVDIIAAAPAAAGHLQLIEIKDFRGAEAELRRQMRTGELPRRLLLKAVHSISSLYMGATTGNDATLRAFGPVLRQPPQRIDFIFFLEQDAAAGVADPNHPAPTEKAKVQNRALLRQDLSKRLREKLRPLGFHVVLADVADLPPNAVWTARSAPPAPGL